MPFKTASGKLLYRVGDVIISTNSENPSKIYGGSWELLCPGRTLVCINTNDSDFSTVKKLGGNKYLQSHNHIGSTSEIDGHIHTSSIGANGEHSHTLPFNEYRFNTISGSNYALAYVADSYRPANKTSYGSGNHSHSISINKAGNHAHSFTTGNSGNGNSQNLQPFMVVYMWVRVS